MFVQTVEVNSKATAAWFFIAVGSAVALVSASNYLISLGYKNADIGAYIILGALAVVLVSRVLTGFRYTLDGTMLYFERTTGKRVYLIGGIDVRTCEYFGAYDKRNIKKAKTLKATNRLLSKGAYALDFTLDDGGGLQRMVFHPNDELVGLIDGIVNP